MQIPAGASKPLQDNSRLLRRRREREREAGSAREKIEKDGENKRRERERKDVSRLLPVMFPLTSIWLSVSLVLPSDPPALQPLPQGFRMRRAGWSARLLQGPPKFAALCEDVSREIEVLAAEAQNLTERAFDPRAFGS